MAMPPPEANPMVLLQQLLQQGQGQGYRQIDPRAGAIERYMDQQGRDDTMLVRPPAQQIESYVNANPNATMNDQGEYPDDEDEEEEPLPKGMTDEQMLENVRRQMMPGEDPAQSLQRKRDELKGLK